MKFQCVPCGSSMKLDHTEKREHGAISLIYACADCGYEMAMVTNPYETQLVASLGADLGDGIAQTLGGEEAAATKFPWTAEAEARLAGAPDFVKPVVCAAIERFARENGYAEVNEKVIDEAKNFLGM